MTVYERIGGEPAVAALLEGLYTRGLADPLLAPILEGIDVPRLKAHQFAFLSQVFGGPQTYTMPSLAAAHARVRIENRHFDAFMGHLQSALRDIAAPEDLQAEILSGVWPLRGVIVNTPASTVAAGE